MKKCKECKSENLKHNIIGNGEEYECNDCGLIAHRVLVGYSGRMGKWGYFHEHHNSH